MILGLTREHSLIRVSNEFLYLIHPYYGGWDGPFLAILDHANTLIPGPQQIERPVTQIMGRCRILIPTFSNGTVHGFASFFSMAQKVLLTDPSADRLVVYTPSQQGLVDLIRFLFRDDLDRLIWIEKDRVYWMEDALWITSDDHHMPVIGFQDFFHRFVIPFLPIVPRSSRICILKSSISSNCTSVGMYDQEAILRFCEFHGYLSLEPTRLSEPELIAHLQQATHVLFSYGTVSFKNQAYLNPTTCRHMDVILSNDDIFIQQLSQAESYAKHRDDLEETRFFLVPVEELCHFHPSTTSDPFCHFTRLYPGKK